MFRQKKGAEANIESFGILFTKRHHYEDARRPEINDFRNSGTGVIQANWGWALGHVNHFGGQIFSKFHRGDFSYWAKKVVFAKLGIGSHSKQNRPGVGFWTEAHQDYIWWNHW